MIAAGLAVISMMVAPAWSQYQSSQQQVVPNQHGGQASAPSAPSFAHVSAPVQNAPSFAHASAPAQTSARYVAPAPPYRSAAIERPMVPAQHFQSRTPVTIHMPTLAAPQAMARPTFNQNGRPFSAPSFRTGQRVPSAQFTPRPPYHPVQRPILRDAVAAHPTAMPGAAFGSASGSLHRPVPGVNQPMSGSASVISAPRLATSPVLAKSDLIWDHRSVRMPKVDGNGQPVRWNPVVRPPVIAPLTKAGWTSKVQQLQRSERARNTYYWHNDAGGRYVHYLDNWGEHWFGFQHGSSFFWLRQHEGRWWWHDPIGGRWLFWANGSWACQDPSNSEILYVDSNGQETPAPADTSAPDSSSADVPPEASSPAPSDQGEPVDTASVGTASADQTFYSDDQSRMIAIYGDEHDALLFDTSGGGDPVYMANLAAGVRDVDFFKAQAGDPLEIVLFMQDGSLQRFDANGKPYGSANGAVSAAASFGPPDQPLVDAGLGPAD